MHCTLLNLPLYAGPKHKKKTWKKKYNVKVQGAELNAMLLIGKIKRQNYSI